MTSTSRLAGLKPTHPGEILREITFPALNRPLAEIARHLGVSRRQLYEITGERRPVTPQMALRLAKLLGTSPELWLNMQASHDLRIAGKELAKTIAAIPTLRAPKRAA